MARLKPDVPIIHEGCTITGATFGSYVEIHRGSIVTDSTIGDYSYCDRYADIANAQIGKFCNIASFARIGPTDHPMQLASLHHFHYRSNDYFDNVSRDEAFFAHRKSRRVTIGHDTWIGHSAVVRPEITIGTGAVVAAMAVVTQDVEPYSIVAGVPARRIRSRFSDAVAQRLISLAWWDWDHRTLEERLEDFRKLPAEEFLDKYENGSGPSEHE